MGLELLTHRFDLGSTLNLKPVLHRIPIDGVVDFVYDSLLIIIKLCNKRLDLGRVLGLSVIYNIGFCLWQLVPGAQGPRLLHLDNFWVFDLQLFYGERFSLDKVVTHTVRIGYPVFLAAHF